MNSTNKPRKILGPVFIGGVLLLSGSILHSCYQRTNLERLRDYNYPITQDTHNNSSRQVHRQYTREYTKEFNRLQAQRKQKENEADYFQDNYDYYQDDPEDEITYPPEIFEAQDD